MMRVVTVASRTPTEAYYCYPEFLASVRRWGHDPLILKDGWGGLATKLAMLKSAIDDGRIPEEKMIFCDSFDVVFQDDPARAVARGWIDYPHKLVFNAEKNLFPLNPNDTHPESPTLWRYLNSGFIVGPTELFLKCLRAIDPNDMRADSKLSDGSTDDPNDQEVWQRLFCEGKLPLALDTSCSICQTMCGVTEDELDFSGPRIVNKITGQTPVGIHVNGKKEYWLPRVLHKLGL